VTDLRRRSYSRQGGDFLRHHVIDPLLNLDTSGDDERRLKSMTRRYPSKSCGWRLALAVSESFRWASNATRRAVPDRADTIITSLWTNSLAKPPLAVS